MKTMYFFFSFFTSKATKSFLHVNNAATFEKKGKKCQLHAHTRTHSLTQNLRHLKGKFLQNNQNLGRQKKIKTDREKKRGDADRIENRNNNITLPMMNERKFRAAERKRNKIEHSTVSWLDRKPKKRKIHAQIGWIFFF